MRDEIAVLKGQKAKPKFKPSGMETGTGPEDDSDGRNGEDGDSGNENGARRKPGIRAGSSKRSKTQELAIHETVKVAPTAPIPEHSRFKGYLGDRIGHHAEIAPLPDIIPGRAGACVVP